MLTEFTELTPAQAETFIRDSEGWALRDYIASRCTGTVLDVGCGNGNDAGRHHASYYDGVDISAPLLAVARKRFPSHSFRRGDARDLDWPAGSVCTTFCVSLIEHQHSIEDARQVVREMLRVASVAAIVGWHSAPGDEPTRIRPVKGHFGLDCYSNRYNRAEFLDGLDHRGLIVHEVPDSGGAVAWELTP
jgi:SAM-dependent methyltransferase